MQKNKYHAKIFDTHAHYDHILYGDKGPELVKNLKDFGVEHIVIPPITYDSNFIARETFPQKDFPYLYFAAGLHPKCAMNEPSWGKEKTMGFETLFADSRTVAVKSGLDFCKKKLQDVQKDRQRFYFRKMMDYAEAYKLPMILHLREAAEEAIGFLKENPVKNHAVAHCYSYDYAVAEKLMEGGVDYFGIGGLVTRPESEQVKETVIRLPIEAILLETDAPFVKPEGFTGELNDSTTLISVAEEIARLKGMLPEEVFAATYQNAMSFYKITE